MTRCLHVPVMVAKTSCATVIAQRMVKGFALTPSAFHICNECYAELKAGGRQSIEAFMEKPRQQSVQDGWEAELNSEFRDQI